MRDIFRELRADSWADTLDGKSAGSDRRFITGAAACILHGDPLPDAFCYPPRVSEDMQPKAQRKSEAPGNDQFSALQLRVHQ